MKKEKSFVKNTAILMFSGIVVKILSALYRVIAVRMVGPTGMGQYSIVFSLFMPFYSMATAGITPTISRLTAAAENDTEKIVQIKKSAYFYYGTFSILVIVICVAFSFLYANYSDNKLIFTGISILCFNLLFATFEAVLKGISQGDFRMEVTAAANVLESGAKVVIFLGLYYFLRQYLSDKYKIIVLFITVSLAGAVCILYMSHDFYTHYQQQSIKNMISPKVMFSMSMPISLSALLVTLMNFFDTVVCIPAIKSISDYALLKAYPLVSFAAENDKALWLYGVYQAMCMSVVSIIPSLSASIGTSTLPLITQGVSSGNMGKVRYLVTKLVKFTSALVIPISLFISFFSYEVVSVLYGEKGAQISLGAHFLAVCVPSAIFTAFSFPMNSILHSFGKSGAVFKILLFSSIAKMLLSYFLCSTPAINVMGFIYSQIFFSVLVFLMSVLAVKKADRDIRIIRHTIIPLCLSYVLLTGIRFVLKPVNFSSDFICLAVSGILFVIPYVAILLCIQYFIEQK